MKKIALFSLLAVIAPCMAMAELAVGTFTDKNGYPFIRESGVLVGPDGVERAAYREVYSYSSNPTFKNENNQMISGKGAVWKTGAKPSTTTGGTGGTTGGSGGGSGGGSTGSTSSAGGAGATAATATAAKTFNAGGAVMGVAGMVTGGIGMYDSVAQKDRKTNWGDVAEGAMSGAGFFGGAAWLLNSVPVGGQVAYGAAVAAGTVIGASGAGLKMFSETDCALDEVLTQARGFTVYQCCHTSQKLSTIDHANYWNIGAYMFCPEPGMVSQCIQQQLGGGSINRNPDVDNRTWDDKWEGCKERWCSGWVKPADGTPDIQYYADYDNYCWKWECAGENMKREGNTCIQTDPVSPVNPVDPVKKKTCEEKYRGYPERIACCKYPSSVTVWTGKNAAEGTCSCVDKNKKWENGQCVDKGGDGVTPPVDNETCWYKYSARFQCPDGKWYKVNETINVSSFVGPNGCSDFTAWLQTHPQTRQDIEAMFCRGDYGVITPEGPSQTEITNAKGRLGSLFKEAESKADVWKDAEGNFNTARLASDLTAGVVLGTVGGVVSGVVITKTQKEKGFDALHCTVGGQKMADWGDVFQVNFRR